MMKNELIKVNHIVIHPFICLLGKEKIKDMKTKNKKTQEILELLEKSCVTRNIG